MSTANAPLISRASRTPIRLATNPVARLPKAPPPRMASMYQLTAWPRNDGDAAVWSKVLAAVFVIFIATPASANNPTSIPKLVVVDIAINIVAYMPFGFFVALTGRHTRAGARFAIATAMAALLSGALETTQMFLPSREASCAMAPRIPESSFTTRFSS